MKTVLTMERPHESYVPLPETVLSQFNAFAQRVVASSAILWGEHCSECAVPSCYSECSFYSPRPDLTCRRFVAGIEKLSSGGTSLHRIRFRKWGKLEGQGPAALRPIAAVKRRPILDALVSTILTSAPQPFKARRHLIWRWNNWRTRRSAVSYGLKPQAFVIESWSADGKAHPFTITFLEKLGSRIYQARFNVETSYGRLTLPFREIAQKINLEAPYLIQIEPSGGLEGCDIVLGFCDFLSGQLESRSQPRRLTQGEFGITKRTKVVVWDLDNTLWDGTLAEDGVEGITLRPNSARAVVELDQRGILNSIASKNESGPALSALEKFGLLDYFLHPQISWEPKSESIGRIVRLLELGIDSFVFIDDEAFERSEVAYTHPGITTVSAELVSDGLTAAIRDLPVTTESRTRRSMYQAEARRIETFQVSRGDYLEFLRHCEINLEISNLDESNYERVYELSQRTNQLNFFGTKYAREELITLLSPTDAISTFVMRCTDRFGDYGIVGFATFDIQKGLIRDFFMSCRVQRKHLEDAFFQMMSAELRSRGFNALIIRFRKTDRNRAAVEMLNRLGFTSTDPGVGTSEWTRSLKSLIDTHQVVRVVDLRTKNLPSSSGS